MPPPQCHAIGCRALTLPFALFCDRCWLALPSDLKRIVEKHHRPNQRRPSKVLERALAMAVAELLVIQTTGRPTPRDRPFEWDDDAPASTETEPALLGTAIQGGDR